MFLIVHTANAFFQSSDRGRDYDSLDAARKAGIAAASDIARGELDSGKDTAAVEVTLKDRDGAVVARFVVSSSVADLVKGAA